MAHDNTYLTNNLQYAYLSFFLSLIAVEKFERKAFEERYSGDGKSILWQKRYKGTLLVDFMLGKKRVFSLSLSLSLYALPLSLSLKAIGKHLLCDGAAKPRELLCHKRIMANPIPSPAFHTLPHTQVFDLKGSLRSRYVDVATGKNDDQVLMDENLLECTLSSHNVSLLFFSVQTTFILQKKTNLTHSFKKKKKQQNNSSLCGSHVPAGSR